MLAAFARRFFFVRSVSMKLLNMPRDLDECRSPSPRSDLPRRKLLPIILIVAVDFMGLGLVLAVMPFYAERNGASPFAVGARIAIFALC
jgi:hypothetical protein